jgi:hypothetical protein
MMRPAGRASLPRGKCFWVFLYAYRFFLIQPITCPLNRNDMVAPISPRDMIVIGGSAGSFTALQQICAKLPADFQPLSSLFFTLRPTRPARSIGLFPHGDPCGPPTHAIWKK